MTIMVISAESRLCVGTCDLHVFKLEIEIAATGEFGAVFDVCPVCQQRRPLVLPIGTATDKVIRLAKLLQS